MVLFIGNIGIGELLVIAVVFYFCYIALKSIVAMFRPPRK